MAGLKKGLVGRIMSKLEDLHLGKALFLHCIIHQQALYSKHLDISCVIKPSHLGSELHSKSRINSPSIPDFS